MKSIHFDVMGFSRTYWDFYLGFGLTISVCLLLFAVLLWQLGAAANTEPQRARPAIATLFVGFAAIALLDWLYFFTVPLVMAAAIALCLALAWASARSRHKAEPAG